MGDILKALGWLVIILGAVALGITLSGLGTWYFWNRVMPDLFAVKNITFTQAVCLNMLGLFISGGTLLSLKGSKK